MPRRSSGLGLDRHPQLKDTYFGNYRRLVYLAQKPSAADRAEAEAIAARMGWSYEFHPTGYGGLADSLTAAIPAPAKEQHKWPL